MKKVHSVVLNSQTFSFHFNWKLALLVAASLPLFIKAGLWQLERFAYKKDLQRHYQQAQDDPALSMINIMPKPYKKVWVKGEMRDGYWLIDNQINEGQFGYEVIQVLEDKEIGHIFIAMGWIKGDLDRRKLPHITPLNGTIKLEGRLEIIPTNNLIKKNLVHLEDKILPAIDHAIFEKITPQEFYPFFVRADKARLKNVIPQEKTPHFTPEKHRAYALQWFSFALITFVMFIYQSLIREK